MIEAHGFTDAAVTVLKERYLHKKPDGKQETLPEMFWRVADYVADGNDKKAYDYYDVMFNRDFLPNSPTLMNAGRKGKAAQLSACYVLPVEDSMEGIFDALKNMALIHKSGGGTGFNFSKLRPKGSRVDGTDGLASGPVSFMRLFDDATECVMQGGMRRGANMGILSIHHPDAMEFINCKRGGGMTNFNISVGMTDRFMKRVYANRNTMKPLDPEDAALWDAIIDNAWATGDPGLVFLDEINRHNYAPEQGQIWATNPCGEVPGLPFEACNLGSINLSNFVEENIYDTGEPFYIDWARLRHVVNVAVDFLNDVIDVNHYPLPQVDEQVKRNRTIGLGVMGWADMLFKLGVVYGSEQSLNLAEKVMSFIRDSARAASHGRNKAVTCIAPTGTISIIAGCSSGIEPVFALEYDRIAFDKDEDKDGNSKRKVLRFIHPEYEQAKLKNDPRIEKGVFVTAQEIPPIRHVSMLAAFQAYTDLAVSKTINLPNSATKRDVEDCYLWAWTMKCKGVTVYRDGCKGEQVLYRTPDSESQSTGGCPECGGEMRREGGCSKCASCGYSPCNI